MILFDANEISPEAYGDCLAILSTAPKAVTPVSVIEIHLFAYLACILALFGGQPVADWGYRFALTKEGFPFSAKLEEARKTLIQRGLLSVQSNALVIGIEPQLGEELELLKSLHSFSERLNWIRTATECTLALPLGSIRHALGSLPSIRAATNLNQNHALLQQNEIDKFYEEYSFVAGALEEGVEDVLAPAVIWLSARLFEGEEEGQDAN